MTNEKLITLKDKDTGKIEKVIMGGELKINKKKLKMMFPRSRITKVDPIGTKKMERTK